MSTRRDTVLYAVLLLACALIVLLAVQNRRLRGDYDALANAGMKPQVGSWVPASHGIDIDGASHRLGEARDRRQILYFFDPECAKCNATAPAIRSLAAVVRPDSGVEVIAVVNGSSRGVPRDHGFDFPVVQGTPKLRALFNVNLVPLLIVVDHDGRVVHSHVGTFGTREQVALLMSTLRSQGRPATDVTPQGETP